MSGRKTLPHATPRWLDPSREIFFITISARPRGLNQLANPQVTPALLSTIEHRHSRGEWFAYLFLFMPDHVHALLSFPPNGSSMQETIGRWKRWTACRHDIDWQRDFFDHRLRHDESAIEKSEYILQNPVRAGLIEKGSDWPYIWKAPEAHFLAIQR